MKILFLLLLLGGALVGVLYFTGTFEFDPAKQAADARAAVKPGMAWNKVVAAIGEPREYRIYIKKSQSLGGHLVESVKLGPAAPYDGANITARLNENTLPEGFLFQYTFSASDAFNVVFDGAGDVSHVENATTMRDLLDLP